MRILLVLHLRCCYLILSLSHSLLSSLRSVITQLPGRCIMCPIEIFRTISCRESSSSIKSHALSYTCYVLSVILSSNSIERLSKAVEQRIGCSFSSEISLSPWVSLMILSLPCTQIILSQLPEVIVMSSFHNKFLIVCQSTVYYVSAFVSVSTPMQTL